MAYFESSSMKDDRFHPNPYIGKEASVCLASEEQSRKAFSHELKVAGESLMKELTHRLVSSPDPLDDHSVYTGSSGINYLYWHLLSTNKIHRNPHISKRLDDFVHSVCKEQSGVLKGKRFTFLCGDAGPLVLAMMISNDVQVRQTLREKLLDLQDLVYKDVDRNGSDTPNELLYGRAGYLYSLLYLNEQSGHDSNDARFVPSDVIEKLVSSIIEDGVRMARDDGIPLYYEWHEKCYLGAAHGYVGILYMLLKAKDHLKPRDMKLVEETVDWLLTQRFPSGNLRSSVGSKDDKLVHWCHGSPGAIYLFLEAAAVYGHEKYLKAALTCGDLVWNRGILKKSYSICHGVTGNAYALMALYQHTKDEVWLRRSCLYARWCFSWGSKATRVPDRPNSLFEGLAGTVYMLHDFLSHFDSSSHQPTFPGFQLH